MILLLGSLIISFKGRIGHKISSYDVINYMES